MNRKRIAVIAYAFSPSRGSEFAQGWNYINQLSNDFDVHVFVGSSDGRMGQFQDLNVIKPNFRISKINVTGLGKFWRWLDISLGISWAFVYALRAWNTDAVNAVKSVHELNAFDFVHHLGPIGFKTPSNIYKLGIPSYWGPIGGFQYINLRLAWISSKKYFITSLIRNILTWYVARSPFVRSAIHGFDAISYATQTNKSNFNKIFNVPGEVLSDQACRDDFLTYKKNIKPSLSFNVVWCGSLDARKNVRLLIDICKLTKSKHLKIVFNVIGDGPLRELLIQEVSKHNLDVIYHGFIPRSDVANVMKNSNVILFTSLSEANTSTFFEGLENLCVPIAFDLDGFSTNITNDIGFRISLKERYHTILHDYVSVLEKLYSSNDLLESYRFNISESLSRYDWNYLYKKHKKILRSIG